MLGIGPHSSTYYFATENYSFSQLTHKLPFITLMLLVQQQAGQPVKAFSANHKGS